VWKPLKRGSRSDRRTALPFVRTCVCPPSFIRVCGPFSHCSCLCANPRSALNLGNKQKSLTAATAPTVPAPPKLEDTPSFAVFNPTSNFTRSKPGTPAFTTAVFLFNSTRVRSGASEDSIAGSGVPLVALQGLPPSTKIAVVSDGGSVMMYSLDDTPIPPIIDADKPTHTREIALATNIALTKSSTAPITIAAGNLTATLTPYGATLMSLKHNGDELLLGYDTVEEYIDDPFYIACTVGRVANRIKGGELAFKDPTTDKYVRKTLDCNNGPNHLHGGRKGFNSRVWRTVATSPASVKFALTSEDGDQVSGRHTCVNRAAVNQRCHGPRTRYLRAKCATGEWRARGERDMLDERAAHTRRSFSATFSQTAFQAARYTLLASEKSVRSRSFSATGSQTARFEPVALHESLANRETFSANSAPASRSLTRVYGSRTRVPKKSLRAALLTLASLVQNYTGKLYCTVEYRITDQYIDIIFDSEVLSGVSVIGLTNHA